METAPVYVTIVRWAGRFGDVKTAPTGSPFVFIAVGTSIEKFHSIVWRSGTGVIINVEPCGRLE